MTQSISEYAEIIAESIANGQHRQAVEQFEHAQSEHCPVMALLEEIAEIVGADSALKLAALVIVNTL